MPINIKECDGGTGYGRDLDDRRQVMEALETFCTHLNKDATDWYLSKFS